MIGVRSLNMAALEPGRLLGLAIGSVQEHSQQEGPVSSQKQQPFSRGAKCSSPYRINLTQAQAPAYVTYPYVLKGYRSGGTYSRCLAALFELHTETMNAWTMIITALLSLVMLYSVVGSESGPATWSEGVAFCALTISVWLHMPWSVGFHLFRGINPQVYNLWRRLDQVFIFVVSVGLTFGLGYHVLPWWGVLLNVSAALGVCVYAVLDIWSLPPDFRRNRNHLVAFVGMIVACYWFPMGFQAVKDLAHGNISAAALYALGTAVSIFGGGYVFATGTPERFFPHVFDIFGSSHQLMHVGAMLAHVCEYLFVLECWRRNRVALNPAAAFGAHAWS